MNRSTSSPPAPGRDEPGPPVDRDKPWLAPLAGFSDLPFRMLCREYGAAVACTEMVSAKGLVYGGEGSWDLVRSIGRVPEDAPLVVQVFGAEVHFVREAVRRLLELGAVFFDLNAGCPVKKVVKTGAGAGLLRDSGRLRDVLQGMVDLAGAGRVGVKIRSGWSDAEFVAGSASTRLDGIGLGWMTLHPRSAVQGLSGSADWSDLKRLRERTTVPLLASGDMHTSADGLACLERGKADGVMYARGAMGNPIVFRDHLRALRDGEAGNGEADQAERLEAARRHVTLCRMYADGRKNLLKMRTILPKYLKGFAGASAVRSRLVRASSWDEVEALLAGLTPERQEPFGHGCRGGSRHY